MLINGKELTIGQRADLSGADLSYADLIGADLRGADLRGANLSYANLRGADLSYANLRGADLRSAYLSCANLRSAYLRSAYLRGADLGGAHLRGASLRDADLSEADLKNADLSCADLSGADLRGADLSGAKIDKKTADKLSIVPEFGAFIGWKKCRDGVIVKLQIPSTAKRSNATGRKCRASKVRVLQVIGGEYGVSFYDCNIRYVKGKTLTVKNFCDERWQECAAGIHFFITRSEAEAYE